MKTQISVIFIFISSLLWAQTTINKTYPKPDWDYSTAITESNDSYLIASSSRSKNGESYDVLLMNIDSIGNINWEKYIGDNKLLEFANNICRTKDGNYIIGGSLRGNGYYDTFVLKIDSEGNKLWSNRINKSSFSEDGFSAFENNKGEIVILGYADNSNSTHLYNLSSSGNLNWFRKYDKFECKSIQQGYDNGYVLVGTGIDSVNFDSEITFLKTDLKGNVLYRKNYGGEGDDFAKTFTSTIDSCFVIAGNYDTQDLSMGIRTYILKVDSKGDTLWTETQGFIPADYICKTLDGGFVYSSFGSYYGEYDWVYDMKIIKINSQGNFSWIKTFDHRGLYTMGNHIHQLNDGHIIITCHTTNSGSGDIAFIKLDSLGNVVSVINSVRNKNFNTCNIFPNPTSHSLEINCMDPMQDIQVFDLNGKIVHKCSWSHLVHNDIINIQHINKGIYLYKVLTKKGKVFSGKFIKE